jgi:hypothetical protein
VWSLNPTLQPWLRSSTSSLPETSFKPVNKFRRATNQAGNSVASSNDAKPIPTNNLEVTPQPMTAALIFRRQLVRSRPLYFQQALADKLPLEKFHRLLDLVFWIKFLKFETISCFVFLWDVYRVSLDPVILLRACGAPVTRPGGRATLSCSPRPTISDR